MQKRWHHHVLILALYGALTLMMTLPTLLTISTHVVGQGGDPWQTMWRFEHEWENRNVLELFGGGEARLVNISVWPWMWLHLMFGQPVAYNLVYLLSFVLSGYCMYLLVKYLTKHETAAVLSGVLYMFLPFHVAHSFGHFGAMQTQWLPLAILLLLIWVKRPTLWRTLGLALVVALQSWSEHHYMLWFVIFAIIFALFRRRTITAFPRDKIRNVILLVLLVFVLAFVPWLPTVRLAFSPASNLALGQEQTIRFSADLFSYITPPQWQPLWGGVSYELFGKHFTGNVVEATEFVGFMPLLLLLFFHQRIPRRQKLFWFWVGAVFFLISLGPRLHVFGKVLPVPLPYTLFDSLPVFSAVRAVARAGIMVGLSACVLFGWVIARELRRPVSTVIMLAVILAEFLFLPVPLEEVKLSQVYQEVAKLPGRSLVEIPAATNYTAASEALYASRIHGKEVPGNIALERALDQEVFAEAKSLPALRQLLFLRTAHILENRTEFFEQSMTETLPDTLKYLDAPAIAVRVDSLSAEQRRAVEYLLAEQLGWPGKKYGDVVLYQTQSRESDGIFLARDGRWEGVGYDPKRESTFAEIPREAAVTLYNVRDTSVLIELDFEVESGSLRILDRVGNGGEHMRVPLNLAPGKQEVIFESLLPGKAIIRNPKLIVL